MTDFEEMARRAKDARDAEQTRAKTEAAAARAAEANRQSRVFDELQSDVGPVLREAAKGLKAAGVEAEVMAPQSSYGVSSGGLKVGHNMAGQTLHRVATITVTHTDPGYMITVESGWHSKKSFKSTRENARQQIMLAVQDALDRWHELDIYARSNR